MPAERRQRLGRGLDSLIPGAARLGASRSEEIPIDRIEVNPYQPRQAFEDLEGLRESIRQSGMLQPVVVARREGGYRLIVGERRLRAVRELGWREIPAVIREVGDEEQLLLALVENLQREDLSPVEEARAYEHLADEFGLTQAEVAERVGKDRSTVANALRLLQLPEEIQGMVQTGELAMGHARALLGMNGSAAQIRLARKAVREGLSVRAVEAAVGEARGEPEARRARKRGAEPAWKAEVGRLERELTMRLGTEVKIRAHRDGTGRLEIRFYSWDDLDRLVEELGVSGEEGAS